MVVCLLKNNKEPPVRLRVFKCLAAFLRYHWHAKVQGNTSAANASTWVLPLLRLTKRASSSALSAKYASMRLRYSPRCWKLSLAHSCCAVRALSIMVAKLSKSVLFTWLMVSPVAGLISAVVLALASGDKTAAWLIVTVLNVNIFAYVTIKRCGKLAPSSQGLRV